MCSECLACSELARVIISLVVNARVIISLVVFFASRLVVVVASLQPCLISKLGRGDTMVW